MRSAFGENNMMVHVAIASRSTALRALIVRHLQIFLAIAITFLPMRLDKKMSPAKLMGSIALS